MMKHLNELWEMVAASMVPVDGETLEGMEEVFEACDALIDYKIERGAMVSFEDIADTYFASLEESMRRLVVSLSTMEPAEQTAAAERARRLVTSVVERGVGNALDNLAERTGRTRNTTRQ